MTRMSISALAAGLTGLALTVAVEAAAAEKFIVINMTRTADHTAYLANFSIGTPPQYQSLKVDSGSPYYAFLSPRNTECTESDHPCIFGTYDNLTSTSARYASPGFYDGLIDHGAGDLINDTVSLGGKALQAQFGYVTEFEGQPEDVAKPTTTILGLAFRCADATGPNCTVGYTSYVQQLYNAGVIDRRAYSFYLGPERTNGSGHVPHLIIGGYIDPVRQAGKPFAVPMVDPTNEELALGQTNTVNVTGMSVMYPSGTKHQTTFGARGVGLPALVDTGNPYLALPEPIFGYVVDWFGPNATYSPDNGYYDVPCSLTTKSPSPTLQVQFPGNKTNVIDVSFNRLISHINSTNCVSYIENGGKPSNTLPGLGDPFIRSTYVTFDIETLSVVFSQVNYTSASALAPFVAP